MSEPCPICATELKPTARYCPHCGLEARPLCPVCGEHQIALATLAPGAPGWCDRHGMALYACETCGRWLLPTTPRCPNPECQGRVLPPHPQSTGRRSDGRGSAVDWIWPARWDRAHPQASRPHVVIWNIPDAVHACLAAYGGIFLWAGARFVALDIDATWPGQDGLDLVTAAPGPVRWRRPLDASPRPAQQIPFEDRIAVVGDSVVLASETAFLCIGLRDELEQETLDAGRPIAHVGGPHWWAGWGMSDGEATLSVAAVGAKWNELVPARVETPAAARIAPKGRMALQDDTAYWPGQDQGVWELRCDNGSVRQVVRPMPTPPAVWAEADGPRTVRTNPSSLQVLVGLTCPTETTMREESPVAVRSCLSVMSDRDHVVVIGDRIVAIDLASGESSAPAMPPPGQWIAASLVRAQDGSHRLLTLTKEAEFGRLYAQRLAEGVTDILWQGRNIQPRALLPVGERLYIVHDRGLIALTE